MGFFEIYMSFSAIVKAIRVEMTLKDEIRNQNPGETDSFAVRLSKQLQRLSGEINKTLVNCV